MCTAELMQDLISGGKPQLLEPIMKIEISCPREHVKGVINNLLGDKRGRIQEVLEEKDKFGKQISDR